MDCTTKRIMSTMFLVEGHSVVHAQLSKHNQRDMGMNGKTKEFFKLELIIL